MRAVSKWVRRGLYAGSLAGLLQACGSDELGDDGGAGRAGSSGSGTAAGSAGRSGAAQSGAGQSGAGRSGAGSGGSSGLGGGGASGDSAGRAGSGGNACIPQPEEDPLAQCARRVGQPTSECPFEETCVALRCGAPGSQFDASGCRRPECTSDDECADDERCVAPPLQGIYNLCYSSVYESVVNECDVCQVSASADCSTPAFCIARAEAPVTEDCEISGLSCQALLLAQASVVGYLEQWDDESAGLFDALTQCHDRIRDAREACYPAEGGAGGESGAAGGVNGGESGAAGSTSSGAGGEAGR